MRKKLLSILLAASVIMGNFPSVAAQAQEMDTLEHSQEEQTEQESLKSEEETKSAEIEPETEIMTLEYEAQTEGDDVLSTGKCGDNLVYTLNQDGIMHITGTGPMSDYKGYYIDEFGGEYHEYQPWYEYREQIKTLYIEEGVTSVGNKAFSNCTRLESIVLPASLLKIGESAFSGCDSLSDITLPDNLSNIGEYAFSGCSGLSSITLPETLNSIGTRAFSRCNGLTSVTMSGDLMPEGDGIFYGCRNVQKVYLSGTEIVDRWISKYDLQGDIIVQEGVTKIGDNAFASNRLQSITLPSSLENIGTNVFYNCSELSGITLPEALNSIGANAFKNCGSLISIVIPEGVSIIKSGTFSGCSSLTEVSLPEGLRIIGSEAFLNCSSLTGIELPSTLINIWDRAFSGCSGLTEINLPEDLNSVEEEMFLGCTGLNSISLPEGLNCIEAQAFQGCSALKEIELPENLGRIGESAFWGCTSLEEITLPEGIKMINNSLFSNCSSLAKVELLGQVESIEDSAFSGCSSLEGITLPDSLMNIGASAFQGCSELKEIVIPKEISTIKDRVFFDCGNLAKVTLPKSIESIGSYAFYNCAALSELKLTEGLIRIGESAFNGCVGLASVTLPRSIEEIGEQAFLNCRSSFRIYGYGSYVKQYCKENQLAFTNYDNGITVLFHAPEGELTQTKKKVYATEKYGELPLPERRGYVFLGWYTQAEEGEEVTAETVVTNMKSHDLYAHWNVNRFNVNFNAVQGMVATESKNISFGGTYGALPVPTRVGYTFEGWYTQAEEGEKVTEETSVTQVTEHTLYAHWKVNLYQVTFEGEGGSVSPANMSVEYENVYGILPTPVREGYTFQGWYTAKTGGTQVTGETKVTVADNHMLYARWQAKKYQVTFQANGGKVSQQMKTVTYGAKYGTLPTPSRNNYYFLGWYATKSGGQPITNNTLVSTANNHTLYAHWQKKLAAPKITAQVVSYNNVKISWKRVSGASGYVIYRSESKNGSYKQCKTVNAKTTSYTDKKLKTGKSWYYKVAAYKKAGKVNAYGYLSGAAGRTLKGKPQTPVQNIIKIDKKRQNITFSWKSIKNAQKVIILRRVGNGKYMPWKTVSAKKKKYTCSYSGFARKRSYTFRLRAYYTVDGVKIYSNDSNGYTMNMR